VKEHMVWVVIISAIFGGMMGATVATGRWKDMLPILFVTGIGWVGFMFGGPPWRKS